MAGDARAAPSSGSRPRRPAIKGVILASAKKTFFAGADLKGVLIAGHAEDAAPRSSPRSSAIKRAPARARDARHPGGRGARTARRSAAAGRSRSPPLPHRARRSARSSSACPRSRSACCPARAASPRLVRLLGLQAALPYLLEGKRCGRREAQELGCIDELVRRSRRRSLARRAPGSPPIPARSSRGTSDDYKMPGGTPSSPKVAAAARRRAGDAAREDARPLSGAASASSPPMVEGAHVDFDTAMRIESRYLAELAVGQVAKNMIKAFFFDLQRDQRRASRGRRTSPPWTADEGRHPRRRHDGRGHRLRRRRWRGIACVLKDVSQREGRGRARPTARKLLDAAVGKGRIDAREGRRCSRSITPTADVEDLAGCDLIIEAVFENRELKAQVTRRPSRCSRPAASSLATPRRCRSPAWRRRRATRSTSSACTSSRRWTRCSWSRSSAARRPATRRWRAPTTTCCDRQDADRGQRLARLLHQRASSAPSSWKARRCSPRASPRRASSTRRSQAGMPVGPLAVHRRDLARARRCTCCEQTRADLAAEGKALRRRTRPSAVVDKMVQELGRPGARPAAASTTTRRAARSSSGPGWRSSSASPSAPSATPTSPR